MPSPILKHFNAELYDYHDGEIARKFTQLAHSMDEDLPDGPEKSAGLRKLLEAMDCMVRAAQEK